MVDSANRVTKIKHHKQIPAGHVSPVDRVATPLSLWKQA